MASGTKVYDIYGKLSIEDSQFNNSISNVSRKLEQVGKTMSNTGKAMTKYITLPILGASAAIFKLSADFETSMQHIVGLVGESQEQVDAWGKELLDLAPKLGQAPKDLAEGLYFVTSAGIDAKDAMKVLEASAKAATAGLGDVATIADAVTSAVNAYGIETLSASNATDILTAAVKYGKMEATDLAPVLGRLLPTASALGITFNDVAGVLAVMSRTGLDAAEASTSLSSIMSVMLKPSKEAVKILADVGLKMSDLRDIAAKPGGLVEVMRLLDEKFGDNEEALAMIVPNIRALRGVMNVLAQDGASVDKVMQGVANSTGMTDKAFEAVSNTAGFKFKQAMTKIKTTMIELGDKVVPILSKVLDSLSKNIEKLSNWWQGLSDGMQNSIIKFVGFITIAGPALFIIGKLTSGIGKLVLVFKMLGTAGAVGGATTALTRFGGTATAVGGIARFAFNPWVLGIAAVGGGLAYLINKIVDTKDATEEYDNSTATLGGTMTFVELAERRVTRATEEQQTATKNLSKSVENQTVQYDKLATAEALVEEKKKAVTDAMNIYGENSPEYEQAVWDLKDAENALHQQLLITSGSVLQVVGDKGKLRDANNELYDSTNNLKLLNETGLGWQGLRIEMGKVKVQAGSTAQAFQDSFNIAMQTINQSVLDFNGNLMGVDGAVRQLTGSWQNNLGNLQSQASNLRSTINQTTVGGQLQVRAEGGPVSAYTPYLVGERGPELFVPTASGTVVPNNQISTNINGNINIANQQDADYLLNRLDRNITLAKMGVSPV